MLEEIQKEVAERERFRASLPHFCRPNCDLRNKVDSAPVRIGGRMMIESRCGACGRWLGNRPAEGR
ncbi:MAG: hypothetical protein AB7G28_26450 [Pirellulales bacterium]